MLPVSKVLLFKQIVLLRICRGFARISWIVCVSSEKCREWGLSRENESCFVYIRKWQWGNGVRGIVSQKRVDGWMEERLNLLSRSEHCKLIYYRMIQISNVRLFWKFSFYFVYISRISFQRIHFVIIIFQIDTFYINFK